MLPVNYSYSVTITALAILIGTMYSMTLSAEEQAGRDVSTTQSMQDTTSQTRTSASSGASQRVFIDPETGERRLPTAEELLELPGEVLNGLLPGMPESDELIVTPDGMTVLRHGRNQMNFSRAHVHEDGSLSTDCTKPHTDGLASAGEEQKGGE